MKRLLTLALAGLTFAGCDSGPTSVEDFDVQPAVTVSATSLTFTAGQSPSPTFQIRYQGLDSAPEVTAASGVALTLVDETGTPQSGTRTWSVGYTGEVPSAGSVEETVTVRSVSGGQEILDTVRLQVNSPVSISETFQNRFAVVEDYEGALREVTATGGTTVEVVTDEVAPNSNGLRALRVDASGSGAVVFERPVSAPGQGVFTVLLRPDPATDFTLTLTFTDEADGAEATYDVEVPVAAGTTWRRYTVAATQLFEGFNPVGAQADGDGPLLSVALAADAAVTYYVDELAFGTSAGPSIEIEDFETTNNAYLCDAGLLGPTTDVVSPLSDGPTAQTFTYVEGGNCFGYNFQADGPALFLDAESNGVLRLLLGDVSRAFNLFVFVETDGGAYSYGSGIEVPIEPADGFQVVTVPLADLGGDLSALDDAGITNVGFEIRRPESDATTEPISFSIDDIKLLGSN